MKNIKKLIAALIVATSVAAAAQTNDTSSTSISTNSQFSVAKDIFVDWFKDNTNFFGEKSAMVGVGGLYSYGKPSNSGRNKDSTYGAVTTVMFPVDDKGQISVGLYAAYFDSQYFAGSLATTLGKTVTIPGLNEKIFLWVEGGPAVNLNNPDNLLVQGFTGATWKHDIISAKLNADGSVKTGPYTLYLTGGYGSCSGWDGSVQTVGVSISHRF